jgi:imidazolonepropionase-like amidohydrolase
VDPERCVQDHRSELTAVLRLLRRKVAARSPLAEVNGGWLALVPAEHRDASAQLEARIRTRLAEAHAYSPEAIRHSVLNGVRCIEHGNLLDAETAQLMAEHEVFLVPTLVTYDAMDRRGTEIGLTEVGAAKNREVLKAGKNAVELARAAGIRIGFGSDLMGELEDEQLAGLRLQCEVLVCTMPSAPRHQPTPHCCGVMTWDG